ncbi:MAG: hypothetical protein IJ358_03785, partial [Clostridia bacterium]|nr:hypothetical protein [Clostridia bacterium]
MNKYLKILALSSGLIGAIAPTAINMDKNNNDVVKIYENIEKMQNAIPKLSRINYQLNTDFEQDKNVAFIATDDTGEQTELDNSETINYLNETLEQTNIEYEQLKTTLTCAIKDTMDYLDAYKNGETELTNEQKIYIKEHSNSIKYLAETLEDLSKEVIMTIDGCEDCDNDEQFNETTSKYITAINGLETRIQTLQNALHSLQFINNMCNPYFYAGYGYAHNFINGFNHDQDENNSEDLDTNIDNNLNDTDTNAGQDNNALDNNSTNDTDNNSTD